jgi:flagellar biosynthesis repressor protein FlbT
MALKLTLKPHEKLIIGGAVITNGNGTSEFIVDNKIPILREKDIMREDQANSPCSRIYFVIQLMYIDEKNLSAHHNTYWQLVRELLEAAPSTLGLIDQISWYILGNKYYQALKLTKKLIEYEQEVINNVLNSTERVPDK